MSTSIVSYDDFQRGYLPKLRSKLNSADEPENSYRTNVIGIQINGSTVNLGLLNHLNKLVQIPIYRADHSNNTPEAREKALETVFNIVNDIVRFEKQENPAGKVSIDMSVSGFAVQSHPEFFEARELAPIDKKCLYYVENFPVLTHPRSVNHLHGGYSKSNFHDFKERLEKVLGDGFEVNYSDEAGDVEATLPFLRINSFVFYSDSEAGDLCEKSRSTPFSVNMRVMNDTNTLAFQLGDRLKDRDTVVGVVGGTGFNMGINQGFDKRSGTFENVSNLECGSTVLNSQTINPYLSEIDKIYLEKNPSTKPEWFFASGNNDQGLAYIAQSLLKKQQELAEEGNSLVATQGEDILTEHNCHSRYLSSINQSPLPEWLTESKPFGSQPVLTNKCIMDIAEEGDEFALAMVNDFAKRWGGFIASRLKGKNLNLRTTKFAITGSHLQHLLRIPSAKTAFAEALDAPEDNLINIEKADMDGMQAILKAKIATSKAATV